MVNERVLALIEEKCLNCVPSFIRSYIKRKAVEKVAAENPSLYAEFEGEETPSDASKEEMRELVNQEVEVRASKHLERRQQK